jgi:hypothetical protein
MTILRLPPFLGADRICRGFAYSFFRSLGIAYAMCTVVGCWSPIHMAEPLGHSAPCGDNQVPVLHNTRTQRAQIFVTDPAKQLLPHQASPDYGTRELGWLRAGATDTIFEASGREIAWSPGADFACVPRPKAVE